VDIQSLNVVVVITKGTNKFRKLMSYTISNHKEHIWVWFMLALLSYNDVKWNLITKYKNVVWSCNKVYYNGEIMKTVAH
jgi:hypothetical protein